MDGYAEAFPDMKSNHWITAHIHAYSHFGGVTRILVPDNLKTGVIKNTRTELILNRSYYEMAEHYGTAIIPTRPIKPKDKPNAEGTVNVIETWILAALRNRKFFSFEDLNNAIKEYMKRLSGQLPPYNLIISYLLEIASILYHMNLLVKRLTSVLQKTV